MFNYLDLVACRNEIKVLLIREAPAKMRRAEYIAFYKDMIKPGIRQIMFERMNNAVNQFILKLANLSKLVIHADSGEVVLLSLNISLTCDCRIIADNTVYHNPNIDLDIAHKGGAIFFLSKIVGAGTASRILLFSQDIEAQKASQLGIVDNVVPLKELDQTALEKARSFARISTGYAAGVKKLLNYDIRELAGFLEFENVLLRRLVRSCDLHNFWRLNKNL